MLSFDITDRNIRIIKGVESGGKIKISKAATLNLEEEIIINGHVKDVPKLATSINGLIKKYGMADKEAIVSISSNLTIFKELQIPKTKEQEFTKRVRQEMQTALNIDDSYSVSYVIVGGAEDRSSTGEVMVKVLATACPYEIIECYKKVFQMLNISLRSVIVGCNCITKVLLSDTKIKAKMPLLAVQIDPNFISLNIYEGGQLSFSRFASIDPADYGNSNDYVFEAVTENIFRMLQFHKSRSQGESIENVVFYGDTSEFARLTDELSKMDLNTSIIQVPPQIYGYQNLEFSLYANAIGALFKRNKEFEKINLLETDTFNNNKIRSNTSYWYIFVGVLGVSALLVGGVALGLGLKNKSIKDDIKSYNDKINDPKNKAKVELKNRLVTLKDDVNVYYTMINNAHDAFATQPTILGDVYDKIEQIADETGKQLDIKNTLIDEPKYEEGKMTLTVCCDGVKDPSQKIPAQFVENLYKDDLFTYVEYEGYVVGELAQDKINASPDLAQYYTREDGKRIEDEVVFDLEIHLKGGEIAAPAETEGEAE